MPNNKLSRLYVAIATAALSLPALAADAEPTKQPYSPYTGKNYPVRPFFGDTHVHTSYSFDAGAAGDRLGVEPAFRFARGEELTSSSGQPVRLSRPLDFMVITDHSDGLGFFNELLAGAPDVLADPQAKDWYEKIKSGDPKKAADVAYQTIIAYSTGVLATKDYFPKPGAKSYAKAWDETVKAADKYNEPGRFSAIIGYEWTSMPGGNNIHRNVVYRDAADKAGQVVPFTTEPPKGSPDPRDLWQWMDGYEKTTGGRVLAIAHNGNMSNGIMFPLEKSFNGKPVNSEYAKQRIQHEPLYEVTQIKGDGETNPALSPNDEFANFERLDNANLNHTVAKTREMLDTEYARQALTNGLMLQKKLGTNPYKFGMIGSTDTHTSLTTAEEDNFFGKASSFEPSPHRLTGFFMQNLQTKLETPEWKLSSSGYAAVWAPENTREALFDAMERKDVYATTGPRMVVRFFGGWDYTDADTQSRNIAEAGYTKGVSMGGDLNAAPKGKVPTFLISALKDPTGANLDRYQIVKGWVDAKGKPQEKIYDVAWSGDRKPDPKTGKVPAVGSTVDVKNATWTNTIGASELVAVWKDPEFDPSQSAVYYGRVIEIPTPRWTAYDAKHYNLTPAKEITMVLQERAYTSPIWYNP